MLAKYSSSIGEIIKDNLYFWHTANVIFQQNMDTSHTYDLYLFVGSYAEATDPGISLYQLNSETGESRLVKTFSGILNPSYLALSRDGQFLYAVSETATPEAQLVAYAFDKQQERLTQLNAQPTGGSDPCFVWVDSQRRLAVTANYTGGNISFFPIAADGSLSPAQVMDFQGGTPGSARQEKPHLHCIYASPDERFLYGNDLGCDRIYKYNLLPEQRRLTAQPGTPDAFALPAGEGPRHTTFHPNGQWAYLISELSGRVAAMRYEEGNLTPFQFIEADPFKAAGSADIHISPDGRYLYASNRLRGDGISIFEIDPQSGKLEKLGYRLTGIHPRNFNITPNGQLLLCACRDSNVIQVFRRDERTGFLHDTEQDIHTAKPVCLLFLKI